jgi:hypothetical protein
MNLPNWISSTQGSPFFVTQSLNDITLPMLVSSSKHQVTIIYCSSVDMGLLHSKVTIQILGKIHVFLIKSSQSYIAQICMHDHVCSSTSPSVCDFSIHMCVCVFSIPLDM